MAKTICNAASLGFNQVNIQFPSTSIGTINTCKRTERRNILRTISNLRNLRPAAPHERPVLAGNREPTGWSEEELKTVQQDLEGDDLSTRWGTEVLETDVKLLTRFRSRYNFVQVLEVSRSSDSPLAGSRVLTLDRPCNIHSVQYKLKVLTGSYYDAFGAFPPLLPQGPVAILGLGAGTVARILHHFWPSLEMHGWELDASVVGVARRYFGLLELETGARLDSFDEQEKPSDDIAESSSSSSSSSKLVVHVGDALSPGAAVEGGFAGICVDLFSEGKVIGALQDCRSWERLKKKLKPGGRIMVNCGGSCVEAEDEKDGNATMRETVEALAQAFPGQVSTRTFYPDDNCMALTGPFPELREWKRKLPRCLQHGIAEWRYRVD